MTEFDKKEKEQKLYDEMEDVFDLPKEFGTYHDQEDDNYLDYCFLETDANELLANIGLEQNMNISNYPREQVLRLFRYYHLKSESVVDGKKKYVDPLPDYKVNGGSYEEELYKFGYNLGKEGKVGIYYRLLPIDEFRKGYYVGKMERYIDQNDQNILRELRQEIKVYDVLNYENEIDYIVGNIFKESKEDVSYIVKY